MQGIAFKVAYNDGGARPGGLIGYKDICSDRAILENIKLRKNINCSVVKGPCKKYYDNNFSGNKPDLDPDGILVLRKYVVFK
jgi:hypothetical protein